MATNQTSEATRSDEQSGSEEIPEVSSQPTHISHTVGEWVVGWGSGVCGPRGCFGPYLDGGGFMQIPIRVGRYPVAWVIEHIESGEDARQERMLADARLIAAAPELLAALKDLAKFAFDNELTTPGTMAIMHAADAAIAKAEGRS